MPRDEVMFDAVAGEPRVLFDLDAEVVRVLVSVSGTVIVFPVVRGAVGAVFGGFVLLHGIGQAGDDEPVAGSTSVDEELPSDGTGK